jgi:hypothetical protein
LSSAGHCEVAAIRQGLITAFLTVDADIGPNLVAVKKWKKVG